MTYESPILLIVGDAKQLILGSGFLSMDGDGQGHVEGGE